MKKKILFLIESFIVGGAEKILIDIVNKLNPDFYDITVCSIFKYSVFSGYQKYFENPFSENVHYFYCIDNSNSNLYRIASYMICHFPSLFYKMMIGDKYDTVIAFYEGMPTSLVASARIKGKKIAWLHTTTNYSQVNKHSSQLKKEELDYLSFEKIVSVSEVVKGSFLSLFRIDNSRTEVIYNSIDLYKIQYLSNAIETDSLRKKGQKIFLSLGRLTPVKGFDRIIEVAKQLKTEGYSFCWWIIGDGTEADKLKKGIIQNGLENEVLLLGHKDNPYPYILAADCYVSTSHIEGFSLSVVEAMALRKMVFASNIPVHREVLTCGDLQGGLLFEDNERLFLYLKRFLLNDIAVNDYQRNAYEIVLSRYLSNIQIKKISALL